MKSMPENLRYATTHEWADLQADGVVKVGITDFAQSELGDIVFIGLPEVGRKVIQGEAIAVVESVKTASDLHAPVSGTVVAINSDAQDEPEQVNEDAFGTWLFAISSDNSAELNGLMLADAYLAMIEE